MPPKDPLDDLLDRWNRSPPDAPGLQREVWRRIAAAEVAPGRSGLPVRLGDFFRRSAYPLVCFAACALAVLAFVEWREVRLQRDVNAELAHQYLRVIDPLLGAPKGPDSLDRELAWIRDELRLTPSQFAQIRDLHETLNSKLLAMDKERLRLRQETDALERQRRAEGQVDFLVFARLTRNRQVLDLQTFDSIQQLVSAAAAIMTNDQRQLYMRYVHGALSHPPQSIAD